MELYCRADNYEDEEAFDVRRWIDQQLHITCGAEILDEHLEQSPFRRLVIGSAVSPAPWQKVVQEHIHDGASISRTWALVDVPVAEFAAARKAKVAAARWQAQNAGVEYNGHQYHSDHETSLYFSAAAAKAQVNPAITLNWKTKTGEFTTLDATAILAVGEQIFTHVQDCFGTEGARIAAIDAIVEDSELTDQQKLMAINDVTWD